MDMTTQRTHFYASYHGYTRYNKVIKLFYTKSRTHVSVLIQLMDGVLRQELQRRRPNKHKTINTL